MLTDPERANRVFEPSTLITVNIPNVLDRRSLFLGRFERRGPIPDNLSALIGNNATDRCTHDAPQLEGYRARARNGENVGPDGWSEILIAERPRTWAYVKPAADPNLPNHFDTLQCNILDACYGSACIGPIKVNYMFFRASRMPGSTSHPRSQWNDLVQATASAWRLVVGEELWRGALAR